VRKYCVSERHPLQPPLRLGEGKVSLNLIRLRISVGKA
jgi:hypothetical protein